MSKWVRWRFWATIKKYAEERMKAAWMSGGNCDSCCPNCKWWESAGNEIVSVLDDDDAITRTCLNCSYQWRALFTPAGFVPLEGKGDE